jgi:hypothetical protein
LYESSAGMRAGKVYFCREETLKCLDALACLHARGAHAALNARESTTLE